MHIYIVHIYKSFKLDGYKLQYSAFVKTSQNQVSNTIPSFSLALQLFNSLCSLARLRYIYISICDACFNMQSQIYVCVYICIYMVSPYHYQYIYNRLGLEEKFRIKEHHRHHHIIVNDSKLHPILVWCLLLFHLFNC